MKKYIKFELLLDDPQYVIKRIFQRILIVNRNTSQRKKGIVNMILFLSINMIIGGTQILLAYLSMEGNHLAAQILLFLLLSEFVIKILFILIHSGSLIYALFISMPIISLIIPVSNIIYNIRKKMKYT